MNLNAQPHWTQYSHNPLSRLERDLIVETRQAVETERGSTVRVIELFAKLDQGKTYLKLGFSSLYEFAVKDLRMSEGAAHRRISAMRATRGDAGLLKELELGEIKLSSLSMIEQFSRRQARAGKPLTSAEKSEVIRRSKTQSTRELERALTSVASPEVRAQMKEHIRPLTDGASECRVQLSQEAMRQLQDLLNWTAHTNPSQSISALITGLIENAHEKEHRRRFGALRAAGVSGASKENGTQKKETTEKDDKALSYTQKTPKSPAHHRRTAIPAAIKRVIWARDQGICQVRVDQNFGAEVETQVSGRQVSGPQPHSPAHDPHTTHAPQTSPPATTRLCGSRTFLHIDHKTPVHVGGTHDPNNLRLCCGAHNRARKSH